MEYPQNTNLTPAGTSILVCRRSSDQDAGEESAARIFHYGNNETLAHTLLDQVKMLTGLTDKRKVSSHKDEEFQHNKVMRWR